mmetsp:Transcript_97354/g.270799  ORF Transcript_97354/g.270799 Transcript_97354/m.270799 type:complete len:84 (-) Transcript_97354:20-271(-)
MALARAMLKSSSADGEMLCLRQKNKSPASRRTKKRPERCSSLELEADGEAVSAVSNPKGGYPGKWDEPLAEPSPPESSSGLVV